MRNIPRIILTWLIGLLIFLVILFILNKIYISLPLYVLIVDFINKNSLFFITMSILFMISDVFFELKLPFNLPAPLFSSAGAVLVTIFIIRMLLFLESILGIKAVSMISFIFGLIYAIVFVVVLIGGYLRIFSRAKRQDRHERKTHRKSMN